MSLAYFPMFPDDFEADTAHLTLAEDGAYNRLLRLCWRTPGCSIPSDRQWIYRRMRAASDDDKQVIDVVLDEFFTEAKQRYSNARLVREYEDAKEKHERRKNAGSKGGRSKARKTNDFKPSNAVAKRKQPEPEPEPYTEVTNVTSDGAVAPLDMRTRLFREGLASIHRQTGRREDQCRAMLGKFLKLAYDDCEKVLNTILQAERDRVASPEPWIIRVLQDRKEARRSAFSTTMQNLTEIMQEREDERNRAREGNQPVAGFLPGE